MDRIIDQIKRMPLAEKRELAGALRSAIADDLAACARDEPDRCPRCGCPAFVRKGRDASGAQRRLCRGCARTFGAKTLGLLGRSKLPPSAWMGFAACMADALPLRETARRVGTSLYTAWYMRMRVCEVMGRRLLPLRGESFEVDGTYFHGSLPGDHARSGWFGLGREPHRTGHDAGSAGLGKKACVLCGVSELGDCFCELVDGAEDKASASVVLGARLPASCSVATDGRRCFDSDSLGGRSHEVRPSRGLEAVNSLHSRLKAFLGRFNGVSNRRLQRYLDWFCYREQFRNGARDRRELLYSHEASGRYVCTRVLTHLEPRPFMSCVNRWTVGERYGYMSMVV